MKRTLKSNKGFSLVELIVVVLIMAIIAVALAPQVMKWVGHSRTSTDANTYDTLYENIQLALADEGVLKEVTDGTTDIVFKITSTETTATLGTSFEAKMKEICGDNWKTKVKKKDSAGSDYVITVKYNEGNINVDRTTEPSTDKVKQ